MPAVRAPARKTAPRASHARPSRAGGPDVRERAAPAKTRSKTPPPEPATEPLDRRDWIAGLEKGLSIIEAFDDDHARMTPSEAGARCGLTRTAARRYLLTLAHLGYVRTDGKLYWLTPRVLRLAHSYLESARLPRIVQPFLQRITAGTHESAYVCVLDEHECVYVARNGTHYNLGAGFALGARVPAHVTAAGMLLLAMSDSQSLAHWFATCELKRFTPHSILSKARYEVEFARIRANGWALSEQQLELNYRGVAVPLLDRHGDLAGALNVSVPIGKESGEDALRRLLPVLQETAQAMRNLV